MLEVYDSREIGLFVVLVAKNKAVSLDMVTSERGEDEWRERRT